MESFSERLEPHDRNAFKALANAVLKEIEYDPREFEHVDDSDLIAAIIVLTQNYDFHTSYEDIALEYSTLLVTLQDQAFQFRNSRDSSSNFMAFVQKRVINAYPSWFSEKRL
jgi:uncharacterized protein (DUF2461 family)